MRCPVCKGQDIKKATVLDDDGDVERQVCANEKCGYILKEEKVIERPDGSTQRRARRVKQEDQPEEIRFAAKGEKLEAPEEKLPTAQELMERAIREKENKVEEEVRQLKREIIEECAKDPTRGQHEFRIDEDNVPSSDVVKETVKELRGLGYNVSKYPEPGKGLWILVKWPTRRPKKKQTEAKKKKPKSSKKASTAKEQETPKPHLEEMSTKQDQRQKAKHRKKALQARSDSPK